MCLFSNVAFGLFQHILAGNAGSTPLVSCTLLSGSTVSSPCVELVLLICMWQLLPGISLWQLVPKQLLMHLHIVIAWLLFSNFLALLLTSAYAYTGVCWGLVLVLFCFLFSSVYLSSDDKVFFSSVLYKGLWNLWAAELPVSVIPYSCSVICSPWASSLSCLFRSVT